MVRVSSVTCWASRIGFVRVLWTVVTIASKVCGCALFD